jgi:hypothetical protein
MHPGSLSRCFVVTPSDTQTIAAQYNAAFPAMPAFPHARRLMIGTAGAVAIVTPFGDTAIYGNVPAGYLYIEAASVLATGTTASNITAEY